MGVLEKVRKAPAVAVELPLDQIIMGDCIENMRALPDACVDMVFADPVSYTHLRAHETG
jgi:modification methylase